MNVDWKICDLFSASKTWYCPFKDLLKVKKYLLGVDKEFCKKTTPCPGEERVVCNNPTCQRTMFVN